MMNRKADEKTWFIFLLIALVLAIIIIFLTTDAFGNAKKYLPFFRQCGDAKDSDAKCYAVSSCSQLTDNAYITSTERCKDKGKICCVKDRTSPQYTPPTNSPECEGKNKGDPCGSYSVCDMKIDHLECVPKCIYCADNPDDKKVCTLGAMQGKKITALNSDFSCGCTLKQCNELQSGTDYTCILNMCPSNNPSAGDYRCCNIK